MKESLARITQWVKEHPYISAALLIGVVVLGYLAYKRGAFSGSSNASQDAANAGQDASGTPPESGIGASPIPDMSSLGTPATGGGGTTTPSNDTGANNQGEQTTGGYQSSVPLPLPGFVSTPTLSDLSVLQSTAVTQTNPGTKGGESKAQPVRPSPIAQAVQLHPTLKNAARPNVNTGGAQTDSTKVGKGPRFTGWVNGVYYLNGWIQQNPTATVPPITQAIANHPGLASAKRAGY